MIKGCLILSAVLFINGCMVSPRTCSMARESDGWEYIEEPPKEVISAAAYQKRKGGHHIWFLNSDGRYGFCSRPKDDITCSYHFEVIKPENNRYVQDGLVISTCGSPY